MLLVRRRSARPGAVERHRRKESDRRRRRGRRRGSWGLRMGTRLARCPSPKSMETTVTAAVESPERVTAVGDGLVDGRDGGGGGGDGISGRPGGAVTVGARVGLEAGGRRRGPRRSAVARFVTVARDRSRRRTRAAIRSWQTSRGARGTGYLDGAAAEALGSGGAGRPASAAGPGTPAGSGTQQAAAPPPASAELEALFWQSIMNSTDPAVEAYLERFPSGVFRRLAENRLTALHEPAAGRPAAGRPGVGPRAEAAADARRPPPPESIDFGDDTSEWAQDDECDDPPFRGRRHGLQHDLPESWARSATAATTPWTAAASTTPGASACSVSGSGMSK